VTIYDLELQLLWFQAATLAIAGIGKLVSSGTAWLRPIYVLEVVVACGLAATAITGLASITTRAASLAMFASYFVYALVRPSTKDCACFGDHLPRVSKRWQLWRNAAYLVAAVAAFALPLVPGSPNILIDLTVGMMVATIAVVGPATATWLNEPR
jgi:hypothetical protein